MSYCVNCGVELEKSLECCPLCGTEVINPSEPRRADSIRPYSRHLDKVARKVQRRTIASVISVLLLLTAGICAIINGVYEGEFTWSLYVISSLLLAMLVIVLPIFPLNWHPLFFVVIDCLSLTLYMYVLNVLISGDSWFETLALPLIILIMAIGAIDVCVADGGMLRRLPLLAFIVISMSVAVVGIEIIIDIYTTAAVDVSWSWLVLAPCLAVAAILLIVDNNRRIKSAMKKRLHY